MKVSESTDLGETAVKNIRWRELNYGWLRAHGDWRGMTELVHESETEPRRKASERGETKDKRAWVCERASVGGEWEWEWEWRRRRRGEEEEVVMVVEVEGQEGDDDGGRR